MVQPKIITIVAGALGVVGVVGLIAGTALDRAVGEPDLGSRVELDAPVVPESVTPSPVRKATQVAPLPRAADDDADDVPASKPAKPQPQTQPRGDDDDDGGNDDDGAGSGDDDADDRPSKKAPKPPADDDNDRGGDDDADDEADDDSDGDDGGDDGDD